MCRVCKVSIDGLISAIINVVGDKMMSSLTQQVHHSSTCSENWMMDDDDGTFHRKPLLNLWYEHVLTMVSCRSFLNQFVDL